MERERESLRELESTPLRVLAADFDGSNKEM